MVIHVMEFNNNNNNNTHTHTLIFFPRRRHPPWLGTLQLPASNADIFCFTKLFCLVLFATDVS